MHDNKGYHSVDGFSSDYSAKEYLIEYHYRLKDEVNDIVEIKTLVELLPPPQYIRVKAYSLYPDTMTGWVPKNALCRPVPLCCRNEQLDNILKLIIHGAVKSTEARICYLGPRYDTTYFAWKNMSFEFPYGHLSAPKKNPIVLLSGNLPKHIHNHLKDFDYYDTLQFDSNFESGNLDCCIKLFMRVDANTRGHLQWYNFRVSNLRKGIMYRLHICNFQKEKSLYLRGMKPFIRSLIDCRYWYQQGENITYERCSPSFLKAFHLEYYCVLYSVDQLFGYKLSFTIHTDIDNDELQISYCIPYSCSQLFNFLYGLYKKHAEKNIIHVSKLCKSLGGLKVPLLTITSRVDAVYEHLKQGMRRNNKKLMIVVARVHPGYSNGSYMMYGFLEQICYCSQQAIFLRYHIVFKVIPMMNPDGVAIGNYRTGLSGRDFNRYFINPEYNLFVEVHALKELCSKMRSIYGNDFFMFLDFHGHSVKKNVFTYGPYFPIMCSKYYQCKVFPRLIDKHTQFFRYHSCVFRVASGKQSTARAVLIRTFGVAFTYTVEASNGLYHCPEKLKDVAFTQMHWIEMGAKIFDALESYYKMLLEFEEIKLQKRLEKYRVQRYRLYKAKKRMKMNFKRIHSTSFNSSGNKPYLLEMSPSTSRPYNAYHNLMENLFEYIKKEEMAEQLKDPESVFAKDGKAKICSDDEVSEGESDCEDYKDNLDLYQLHELIRGKTKYTINYNKHRRLKRKSDKQSQLYYRTASRDQQPTEDPNSDYKKTTMSSFKDTTSRPCVRKLMSASVVNSPTKEKEEQNSIAKIINFSFRLNPTQHGRVLDLSNKRSLTETSEHDHYEPRQLSKTYEYSYSFRRNFQNAKREALRRYRNKHMSIHSKSKPNMDFIIGRRIFQDDER